MRHRCTGPWSLHHCGSGTSLTTIRLADCLPSSLLLSILWLRYINRGWLLSLSWSYLGLLLVKGILSGLAILKVWMTRLVRGCRHLVFVTNLDQYHLHGYQELNYYKCPASWPLSPPKQQKSLSLVCLACAWILGKASCFAILNLNCVLVIFLFTLQGTQCYGRMKQLYRAFISFSIDPVSFLVYCSDNYPVTTELWL